MAMTLTGDSKFQVAPEALRHPSVFCLSRCFRLLLLVLLKGNLAAVVRLPPYHCLPVFPICCKGHHATAPEAREFWTRRVTLHGGKQERGHAGKWRPLLLVVSGWQSQGWKVWRQGFPEFAQDNNLQRDNTLVFALVAHSRFHFTLFNDQGCQIIPPFRAKQEIKLITEKKDDLYRSTFHSPSCPKHYSRRVQPGLVSHANDVKNIAEDSATNNIGQNKVCQCCTVSSNRSAHSKLLPDLQLKTITIFVSIRVCHEGYNQHEEKPEVQSVNQTLDQSEDESLLEECQKGHEQFQIVKTCLDSNQPRVEERALSEMTTSEANRFSRIFRRSNSITVMKASHVYKVFIMVRHFERFCP